MDRGPLTSETAAKERLLSTLDGLMEGCQVVDRELRYVYLNDAAVRHARRPREELLGRTMMECYPGIEHTPFFGLLMRCLHDGSPLRMDNAFDYPDGSRGWFELSIQPQPAGVTILSIDISGRKAVEEALRRSEVALRASATQLRSFVEHAPAGIAMFDRDMVCLAASRRWVAAWGRGRSDIVGLSHYDVHPDLPEHWKEAHRRGLAGEVVEQDQDSWRQADGSLRWVRWLVQPWRDVAGDVGGIMMLAEDITEAKHEQESLLAERTLLRTVFDLLPDLIYVKDVDHRFIASNAACARYMGLASPAELIGRTDAEFYPPDVAASLRADERAVLGGRPLLNKKEVFPRAGGPPRSLLTTKVPLTDGRGSVRGLVGTGHDVTEREAAELRLKTQHAVTRVLAEATSLAEAAPQLIRAVCDTAGGAFGALWEIDRRARVLRCTALWHRDGLAVEELAAQTRDIAFEPGAGLPGRVWESRQPLVLPDVARDPGFARAEAALQAGLHGVFGFPIMIRDEVVGVMDLLGPDLREPDPDLLDVLSAIGTQIGQFVEHKRADARFIQSQKMEAVGQLAGGIAHDFNNLLGVIIAYADIAKRELGGHRALRRVEGMRKAAERAAALTRQILTFSRKQPADSRVCDLAAIIEDMEKMLRRVISEDIRLVVVPGSGTGRVRADPSQLEQVILNLVVNARDAMPDGGRMVIESSEVSMGPDEGRGPARMKPGPYVVLSVSDTGQGMTPETQARIYEPFFTTKEQGKGTGLGLALVYGVVKQCGGTISVYSEPGRGTTFKVYLPRVDEEATVSAPRKAPPQGGTETILVVEDEDALREIVAEVLATEGYDVLEAGDPRSALVVCAQAGRDVHLVITDVVLPGQSGPETALQIQQTHPKARVLLVSGYTDKLLEGQRGIEPDTPFLGKPFTPDELLHKVREVLDAAR